MADIKFETGLVTYNLNGAVKVSFNPTDSAFVEQLCSTFEALDKKQDSYEAEIKGVTDNREIFEIARKRDAEMRDMIDGAFGEPVCNALFGGMNVYALADGLPVWANLILAVMDEINNSLAREQKKTNPRIAKYTAKYRK